MKALRGRSALPDEILKVVAARLEHEDWNIRRAAVQALGSRSALPDDTLKAVTARLEDEECDVRQAAVQTLGGRLNLPDEILKAVAVRLDDEDWGVQQAAENTLRKQRDFYHSLLNSTHIIFLYRILLRLSFEEQFIWYIEDGDSCVNMAEDIRRISISDHNNYVEALVNARPANYPSICSQ